jgi:dihydropteroate synthase
MGVLNVTPDSFSDGGRWFDQDRAVARGHQMLAEGADIIDVGGESSRPGAHPVPEAEELRRVLPVIERLVPAGRVSVDTRKESVARAALGAGAGILNDTTGGLWRVAAEYGASWLCAHCPAEPAVMAQHAHYRDVVAEVTADLVERAEKASEAGVAELWIDPGIGYAKTPAHNLTILRHLDLLVATGWPVAVGTSRKSFLATLVPGVDGKPAGVGERLEGSLATAAWSVVQGAAMVRVHDVAPTVMTVRLAGGQRVAAGAGTMDGAGVAAGVGGAAGARKAAAGESAV